MQLTCTVGGVISGYCATGNCVTETTPAKVMTIEITEAKMGRLIKILDSMGLAPFEN
jgi:hypothetical protein